MKLSGSATAKGTEKYRQRHRRECAPGHFRAINGKSISSIGIGTYLGEPDEQTDCLVRDAIIQSVQRGINLIDTAINYRYMHAEWSARAAISYLISQKIVEREELIICSKGGFIPHPDRVNWFERNYVNNFDISARDLVAECHCLHPEYLQNQLDRTLENLGLETIDIYYIHNPETQRPEVPLAEVYHRLYLAFRVMETALKAGKIKAYGLATWSAFRVPPNSPQHLSLYEIKNLARKAAGESIDRFEFIQLPFNATMLEAAIAPTQELEGRSISALSAASNLGMNAIASAALGQAKALGKIPIPMPENFNSLTAAQMALQLARSCPGFKSALVGMKTPAYVSENLELIRVEPLATQYYNSLVFKG